MKNKIKKPDVVVIGLGYIGLPTAALISSHKDYVHGVDINEDVVKIINEGKIHIVEPELESAVYSSVNEGYFTASTKVVEADTYLIVVPTPFDENNKPDISYVQSATKDIIPHLKERSFIIESTSLSEQQKNYGLYFSGKPELTNKIYISIVQKKFYQEI